MAAPTSDASIETLLTLTKSENTLNAAYEQIVPVTTQSLPQPQALAGKTLSTQQPQGVETAVQQAVEVMRTELSSWASVRPDVMKIYQGTFLQEEVDGMIAFYRSPPGIAVVEKLPTVMQRSNAFAMARMPSIVAKVNAATKKTMADIKPIQ